MALETGVSIWKTTPPLGDRDPFKDNVDDELDGKSANKGSATEICKCISSNIPKSNLEDDQPFFNAAIPSHTRNCNIQPENQAHLPSNRHLMSFQNEEMVQLPEPISDKEEHVFDSNGKDTDILEFGSILANSYLELGRYKKAMQLYQQILETLAKTYIG